MVMCVFGLPGSGKSTSMARYAYKALKTRAGRKRYDRVYCNFTCAGCYTLDSMDLGTYNFENCLILIDEAMNQYDNRDFKKFTDELKYFFSNHRHYGVDVIYFTQAYDEVDIKIRRNTEILYYLKKMPFGFTMYRPIYRKIMVNSTTNEIQSGYVIGSIFSIRFFFRPKYYKMFDTSERKLLKPLLKRHNIQNPFPESKFSIFIDKFKIKKDMQA